MPPFHPYTIHHIQLGGIDALYLPAGNHYLVIWSEKIPLGHLWLESEQAPVALRDYGEEINAITRPVLEYYTAAAEHGKRPDSLSVVICTRNRPVDLERCVTALLRSSDTNFELIVVDNAPDDDRTEQVMKKFPQVRYILEPRKGLDIARNAGAQAAAHAIIAYTDDDVLVDKDWTRHLKTCFAEDPLVMAVTGLVIPAQLQTRSQYIFERYWGFNKGYLPRTFDHRFFLDHSDWGAPAWDIGAGANMAFRREAFELVGGFDERLDVGASGCSGDSELWYRILAEGWNCRYLPHIFVFHHHRESKEALHKQLFHYMRGHVSALLVQYERYGHKGNLRRLYRGLPKYYFRRIWDSLWRTNPKKRARSGDLPAEISGCLSGWRFYRGVKDHHATGRFAPGPASIPQRLLEEVIIRPDSLVSVIIPCYNHAHYLGSAIETALNQTYRYVEIIVVDDGSTDGTAIACAKYPEVRYVRVERVGPSAARNIGVQCSRGDFIVFLDADDLLYPNAIELNLFYFGLYKNSAFVSGAHDRVDDKGHQLHANESVVKSGDNYWALLQGNYIAMEATVMYRREVFFRFHFDPGVYACEDYDLNLRIARHLPVFGHAGKLAAYRIHGGNRSRDRKMMANSALSVLKRQEQVLQNEAEMQAYRLGIENWQNYYVNDKETEDNKG